MPTAKEERRLTWKSEARILREKGWSYPRITARIGVNRRTIRYNLDPLAKQHAAEYYADHVEEIARQKAKYYRDHKIEILQQKTEYNQEHKTEGARYYQEHKIEIAQRVAQHYQDHKMEIRQRMGGYRKAHKIEIARWDAAFYRKHKKKIRFKARERYHDHPVEYIAHQARRRALKNAAFIGATINQIAEVSEIYRQAKEAPRIRCYLCGKFIKRGYRHVDHIIPLSKGGAHRPANLAVACVTCNQKKHNKMPGEIGMLL